MENSRRQYIKKKIKDSTLEVSKKQKKSQNGKCKNTKSQYESLQVKAIKVIKRAKSKKRMVYNISISNKKHFTDVTINCHFFSMERNG